MQYIHSGHRLCQRKRFFAGSNLARVWGFKNLKIFEKKTSLLRLIFSCTYAGILHGIIKLSTSCRFITKIPWVWSLIPGCKTCHEKLSSVTGLDMLTNAYKVCKNDLSWNHAYFNSQIVIVCRRLSNNITCLKNVVLSHISIVCEIIFDCKIFLTLKSILMTCNSR
jgi:hypothetical protein